MADFVITGTELSPEKESTDKKDFSEEEREGERVPPSDSGVLSHSSSNGIMKCSAGERMMDDDDGECNVDGDYARKRMRLQERILTSNSSNSYTTVDIHSPPQRHVLTIDLPSRKNQDRGKHWCIPVTKENGQEKCSGDSVGAVGIYAVADGHGRRGGSLAENVICSLDEVFMGRARNAKVVGDSDRNLCDVDWPNEEDLHGALEGLFAYAEKECLGIFGDFDGGTTLSVCVDRPDKDLWIAHVGDSDLCLVDVGAESRGATTLSEDHSPLNIDEFRRMIALCPTAKFEYDRQRKDAPPIHIYSTLPGQPEEWQKNPAPTRNVYYKNRANDLATYVSEGGGYSSLANTRAIGDFHMKKSVGLSSTPFVARHPPLTSTQRLVMASDGFWDSWPVNELLEFCEKRKDFCEITSDLEKSHMTTTNKYFGSCSDDTLLYFVQPSDMTS